MKWENNILGVVCGGRGYILKWESFIGIWGMLDGGINAWGYGNCEVPIR